MKIDCNTGVCIHANILVHTSTYTHMHMHMHVCMHTYTHMCVCVCTYIHTYTCQYSKDCMYVYIYVLMCIYIYIHLCTCLYMHICSMESHKCCLSLPAAQRRAEQKEGAGFQRPRGFACSTLGMRALKGRPGGRPVPQQQSRKPKRP